MWKILVLQVCQGLALTHGPFLPPPGLTASMSSAEGTSDLFFLLNHAGSLLGAFSNLAVGQNQMGSHCGVGAPPILEPILAGIGMLLGVRFEFDAWPFQYIHKAMLPSCG